jgi:hypothetical protein
MGVLPGKVEKIEEIVGKPIAAARFTIPGSPWGRPKSLRPQLPGEFAESISLAEVG